MEDSKIDMIFAGNFERLERVKHPIIRVYLSSTYTDMTMEKSILVTEVYPKVKEYCRERYGAEFQVCLNVCKFVLNANMMFNIGYIGFNYYIDLTDIRLST